MKTALINLISEQTIPNLLPIKKFTPSKVYFLHTNEQRFQEILFSFKRYINRHLPLTQTENKEVKALDPQSTLLTCKEIIHELKKNGIEKIIINATGGTKLMAFGALQAGLAEKCPVIYIDTSSGNFINVNNLPIGWGKDELTLPPLKIVDFIELFGAQVKLDKTNTALYYQANLLPFIHYLIFNLKNWKETSTYLNLTKSQNLNFETREFTGPLFIKNGNKKFFCDINILKKMSELHIIKDLTVTNQKISFIKNGQPHMEWLLQYGTALELYIFYLLQKCKLVDDVKAGVEFVWNSHEKVNNELDVIVSSRSRLTCISCKSGKVNTSALNELETYSRLIGGTFVNKILITTRENFNQIHFLNRASKMNIKILAIEDILKDVNTLLKKI